MLFLLIINIGICSIFVQVTLKCSTGGARCGVSVKPTLKYIVSHLPVDIVVFTERAKQVC